MQNQFEIRYDLANGTVAYLANKADPKEMNFVEGVQSWGMIRDAAFMSCEEMTDGIRAVYETSHLHVTVTRQLLSNGSFREEYRFRNCTNTEVFIPRGGVGIYATFNENYDLAERCLDYRCHTHIWCGGEVSYVCARKMGMCDFALGLVLTAGSLDTYSIERDLSQMSNDRGDFIFHPAPFVLAENEEYVLSWELFWHEDGKFHDAFAAYPRGIVISSDAFTVFSDEELVFRVNRPGVSVTLDGMAIPAVTVGGETHVTYRPARIGEHVFALDCGGIQTKAEFYVQAPFEALVRARVEFIVNRQQYHRPGSRLDGAYLIYDNEEDRMYFDNQNPDHNASRERLVMGLLVAKYLQYFPDERIYESFMKYYRFVSCEFYNEETGEVFDTIGMDPTRKRLYNAPWMSMLVMELYKLTGDKSYLSKMCRLLDVYYTIGGERFYPNGLTMLETVNALRDAEMYPEVEALLAKYRVHVGNIVKIGIDYPPHEVKYEQTIVSPGAALTAQMCMLTGDPSLIDAARIQAQLLERFHGEQPSYHFNGLAIRHWDAYWFGKKKQYGDTFPHVASIHSSDAFLQYAQISGDAYFKALAWRGMRDNLCCFRADGRAYSSYVYPFSVNGVRCEYYDPWANEQDGALYFMIKYFGLLDKTEGGGLADV